MHPVPRPSAFVSPAQSARQLFPDARWPRLCALLGVAARSEGQSLTIDATERSARCLIESEGSGNSLRIGEKRAAQRLVYIKPREQRFERGGIRTHAISAAGCP